MVEDQFAIEMAPGKPERVFKYPEDPYLPGLRLAASAVEVPELLNKYAALSPHRLRVEAIRYRPASRAVLRHISSWQQRRLGRVILFVRVMQPRRTQRLLTAAELVQNSGFVMPRFVGTWEEGGVVWMTRIPGETVQILIRKGIGPEPHQILGDLEKLWSVPIDPARGQALALSAGYRMTSRLLSHLLQQGEARRVLRRVRHVLGPFAAAWQPSTLAHNDFYDDQMLVTPDGEIALVDFEEAGPATHYLTSATCWPTCGGMRGSATPKRRATLIGIGCGRRRLTGLVGNPKTSLCVRLLPCSDCRRGRLNSCGLIGPRGLKLAWGW